MRVELHARLTHLRLVIASLIYVAQQLCQNTEAVQVGVMQNIVEFTRDLVGDVLASRGLAEYWFKGGTDMEGLDEVDRQRAILFEYRAIQTWVQLFRLRQKGFLPEEQWNINCLPWAALASDTWLADRLSVDRPHFFHRAAARIK